MTDKKISWDYTHYYNRKSKSVRTKKGVFVQEVHHRGNHARIGFKQMAIVKFEGNKSESRVPLEELKFL